MILDIPFVKNPNTQCGQACVLMVLKYFYPEKKISLNDINKIIRFKPDKWTFPAQLAIGLNHFGIKAKAFTKSGYPTGKKGIQEMKKWFGKDFDEIFNKWIDYPVYEWSAKTAKKNGWLEIKATPFEEIEKLFKKGYLAVVAVDWNELAGVKDKPYEGRFVIITGIEKNNVYINEPDAGKNLKYPKKQFIEAYTAPGLADDICIAYGKI